MTVPVQNPITTSTAAAAATVFPYNFKILLATDLLVTINGVAKVLTTHYTISNVGVDAGGNVTFVTPMVGGEIVVLRRNMPVSRVTDYQNLGDLRSPTLNNDQDSPIMMIQQLATLGFQAAVQNDGSLAWDALNRTIINLGNTLLGPIAFLVPLFDVTGTTFICDGTKQSYLLRTTNAAGVSITIRANTGSTTLDWPNIASKAPYVSVKQVGAGQVNLVADAGVVFTTPSGYFPRTRVQGSIITAIADNITGNAWTLTGDLALT